MKKLIGLTVSLMLIMALVLYLPQLMRRNQTEPVLRMAISRS